MAYQYDGKANQLANSGVRVVAILSDEVPNQNQIGSLLGESFQVFGVVEEVFKAEVDPRERVKFSLYSLGTFASKPAIKNKLKLGSNEAVYDEAIASFLRILSVVVPDKAQS